MEVEGRWLLVVLLEAEPLALFRVATVEGLMVAGAAAPTKPLLLLAAEPAPPFDSCPKAAVGLGRRPLSGELLISAVAAGERPGEIQAVHIRHAHRSIVLHWLVVGVLRCSLVSALRHKIHPNCFHSPKVVE